MKSIVKTILVLIIFTLLINGCNDADDNKLPTVTTAHFSDTTSTYVITGGEVISEGSSPVTARGVCYNTNGDIDPTINDWLTSDSSGLGNYTSKVNFIYAGAALTISQMHYIRAYATNSEGTAYGETISVSPKSPPPTFNSIGLVNLFSTSVEIECEMGEPLERPFEIDEFYLCYSLTPEPTIEGTHVIPESVPNWGGHYKLMNLSPNTTYFVRGYIKNESGFVYSPEISFTTSSSEVTDIDGNMYPTKIIGNQEWMASNLIVSKYNDGSEIPSIYNDWDWSVDDKGAHNGSRYNYYAVINSKNICPSGWHVPTDEEWKTLETYLGMSLSDADNFGDDRGSNEGGKLKMKSDNAYNKKVWEYPNLGATNSTGFSAIVVAWRFADGDYTSSYYSSGFWTKTEYNETEAIERRLFYDNAKIARFSTSKNTGFPVRCIKD